MVKEDAKTHVPDNGSPTTARHGGAREVCGWHEQTFGVSLVVAMAECDVARGGWLCFYSHKRYIQKDAMRQINHSLAELTVTLRGELARTCGHIMFHIVVPSNNL